MVFSKKFPLYFLFLFLFFYQLSFAETVIPEFTPNVVSEEKFLSLEKQKALNQTIEKVRKESGIDSAIYVVRNLNEESIDQLAERAFKQWKLGQTGKDNGLLVVVSIDDSKVRVETGYGLEGYLPDVVVARTLQSRFNPHAKVGNLTEALKSTLLEFSDIKIKQKTFEYQKPKPKSYLSSQELGFAGAAFFGFCVFISLCTSSYFSRKKMEKILPKLSAESTAQLKSSLPDPVFESISQNIVLTVMISVFPGLVIGGITDTTNSVFPTLIITGLYLMFSFLRFRSKHHIYQSVQVFENYCALEKQKELQYNLSMVKKGYMIQNPDGTFEYTQAYTDYQNSLRGQDSNSSSRHSSSSSTTNSSSTSSSSGGGRSGGGGASSNW